MTDARYPEAWLNDRRILRLSDAAHRLFVVANAWSVSNRTDGELHVDDLPLLPGVDTSRADELAKADLWEKIGDRWLIADFVNHQTTRAQLEGLDHKRLMDRERQARHRQRERDRPRDVTRDIHRDETRDTKEGRKEGKDRKEGVVVEDHLDDDIDLLPADPAGMCSVCCRLTPRWLLDERDGLCISCDQARRIGRGDQTDRTAS
jgi:hypothetical protein